MNDRFPAFVSNNRYLHLKAVLPLRGLLNATLACLILLLEPVPALPAFSPESPEGTYLEQKKAGEYPEALETLRIWTAGITDPSVIEVNVFRIRELMIYPELYDRGLEALCIIREKTPQQAGFLNDRIDIMKSGLLLKKGDIKTAEQILARLSFLDFHLMGPFNSAGPEQFAASRCPEQGYDPGHTCPGMYAGVSWFHAAPDRMGTINIDTLNGGTGNSLYYLRRSLTVVKTGNYYLALGKTGYTDIWIDGAAVFSDRTRHDFDHDQYFIPVRLTEGAHRILIKTGGSSDGIQLSLRLAEAGADVSATGRGTFYPPALSSLMLKQDPGPSDWLRAGYLLVESRRCGQDDGTASGLLSRVPESHPLYSTACFYRARAGTDRDEADRFYTKSLEVDPGNLEALHGLALNALQRDLVYDAFPHIDLMEKIGHAPSWYDETMALLCVKMGWSDEALRHAASLKRSPFPSAALRIEAEIYRSRGDSYHESKALELLMEFDRYDRSVYLLLASSYEKTGGIDAAELLLHHAVALYPDDTALKLRLAELIQNRRGPGPALPYLAAALETAPENPSALRALGMAYLNLGKSAPAEHYLRMALCRKPGDNMIRLNLEILNENRASGIRP
jgi:tetratricopeptide (TPR) repeat protein